MKIKLITTVFLIAILGTLLSQTGSSLQVDDPAVLLRAAIEKEDVDGDLQGAIDLYSQIITKYGDHRAIAAKAQLHIGLCYEKLGLKEAQEAYQKVVDDYPGQAESVKLAREKLALILKAKAVVERGDRRFEIRHIWTWPELTVFGSSSLNGKYLSFVDWTTGDLAIREIATGKQRRITKKGVWDDEHPGYALTSRWSPDSKQVAYTWVTANNNSELRTVGLDGAESRILTKEKEGEWIDPVDWSPDGKNILATIHKGSDKKSDLVLVSAVDGTFRTHKTRETGNRYYSSEYLFSPDGLYIACNRSLNKNTPEHDIFLLSLDDSHETTLIQHPAHDYILGWLPDGKKLLFASDRSGSTDAWIIHVDEGKPRGAPILVRRNIGLIRALEITKDGALFYSTPGSLFDIYTASLDSETGLIVDPPKKEPLTYEGSNMSPSWSPDGKYLVYTSLRGPSRGQNITCIYSDETGEVRELMFDKKLVYPRWTHDGRHLYAQAAVGDGQGIYRIDVKTEEVVPFIENKGKDYFHTVQISTDGKWIVYGLDDKKVNCSRILYRNLETDQEKEIDRAPFDNNTYTLSADTKRLALLLRTEENLRVLKVMSFPGGTPKEIHRFTQWGRWIIDIDWSPDGGHIYFSNDTDSDGKWELWRIPSKGGKAQNLGIVMNHFQHLSIHPDGRRITFASRPSKGEFPEIWVMENFLPKITDRK